MHALTLDFRRNDRPHRWIDALLLLAGLALLAGAGWYAWQISQRGAALEGQLAALSKPGKPRAAPISSAESEALAKDMRAALGVATQLNLQWDPMFHVVEAAPQRVALLTLEPDARKHEVVLTGEAKDFAEMLNYVRYLQEQPMFQGINLQTHQINQQDRDKPVRFRITAGWVTK